MATVQATNSAHVRMTPAKENFTALTVCHRTFTDLTRDHSVFSLAVPSVDNAFLTYMIATQKIISPHIQGVRVDFGEVDYAPNKWHSVCTTWDSTSGLVQLWLDGQPLSIKYASVKPIAGKPIVALGQDQDNPGGGFDEKQCFVGMMTDVHVWDHVLPAPEIHKYMRGQSFTPGNVLNWAALDFELKGKVVIENKQTNCACVN